MERFEQAGDILTAKPSGLGLGLPLVREILQRHSGSIALDRAPAGGTIARVLLPFPGSAQESVPREERCESAPQPAGRLME
jgi:signal transduction histidine kinase